MYVYLILDIYLMPIPDKDITREIKKLLQTSISYEHSCKILQKDSYKQNPAAYKNYTLWPSRIYLFAKNARLVHHIRVHEYNQFSCSSCPTLCDPIDWSMPGFPVRHQLPELAQTRVHQVGDAIQPSCPLLSPSPPAFSLSQHRGLFQWVSSLHQVADALELQLQHQSFQWIFRTDFFRIGWLGLLAVQRTLKSLLQHHSSKASTLLFVCLFSFFFFKFIYFNWRLITLQYCIGFAIHQHESTTNVHMFPILNPLSRLPPRTIPLGHLSAPAPSIQYHASNLDWLKRFITDNFEHVQSRII